MLTRHPRPVTEVDLEIPSRPVVASTTAWLQERIDVWIALAVGVSWLVLTGIAFALEPSTDQSEPLIGTLLGVSRDVLFVTMLAGLALRRRWGLLASLGGAGLMTAMVVACPTTGHHQFGTWWYGQMACAFALIGITVAALYRPGSPDAEGEGHEAVR